MRAAIKIFILILLPFLVSSQSNNIDSLRNAFNNASPGRARYEAASNVYFFYQELNRDSALFYTEQQLVNAKEKQNRIGEGVALTNQSYQLMGLGRYADALKCLQQSFVIAEDKSNENQERWEYFLTPFHGNSRLLLLSYTHHMYALLMLHTENLEQQIIHFEIAAKIGEEIKYAPRIQLASLNLGISYLVYGKSDSALYFAKKAEQIALKANDSTFKLAKVYLGVIEMQLGNIYKALKNDSLSLLYYYKSLVTCATNNNQISYSRTCLRLSQYHLDKGNKDSALYYAHQNLISLQSSGLVTGKETNLGLSYEYLYHAYNLNNQFDSAFKYQGLALTTKDSLTKINIRNLAEFQNLTYSEQLRLQNLEKEKVIYQNKVRTYFLLAGIAVLLLLAVVFYRNNRQKRKANELLQSTLTNLKATQSQLIQSEKMASLGELTAGIAHEIQNPLNFVNNFSEVSNELVDEMNEELNKGSIDDAKDIAATIKQNLEKIHHHGKRADSIVKGMLQHSRTTSGAKELTDINALADEYLRLSYHGIRAKDKTFNSELKTDYDKSIGKINIIPQDIGRVILNLITNAFYAVNEKKKQTPEDYEPTVSISTRKTGNKIEIKVTDNGHGIPQKIVDKIFQPFFTTKPTGQGTGLGLSLSYDIVKAHGGELKVKTIEGEETTFIIELPF